MAELTRLARTKILMAVVAGGAVVTMAGLAVAIDDGAPLVSTPVAAPILPGPMTQGDTVTTTIVPVALPGTALATAKAVVTHKAQPYKG
ncbi:hypothetical protein FHT40_004830 [Mycolicibacterium sp. BK556]|uniref:hypothetical protein n=1 Tax=Mycobacteriaceae TaxID=1762 RepID=UPI00105B5D95|nr:MULTISPECIES: hypothetical protein [Mycobacteriaceae]MBB3605146.1 hypothetical protein [Mycolicibacterium sp. BK556]MBB3635342.1 hypothetical protein [Mycolicibacterium sp. BK607]MBB3747864.1 hypothetical protein [Mycolicibacterium sp. BK634]TDO08002.1 hypothetical protein EV580_5571 [Mycobacterium sp. BK086]